MIPEITALKKEPMIKVRLVLAVAHVAARMCGIKSE